MQNEVPMRNSEDPGGNTNSGIARHGGNTSFDGNANGTSCHANIPPGDNTPTLNYCICCCKKEDNSDVVQFYRTKLKVMNF